MTAEEVKAKQDALTAKGYNLGWWYGTRCAKCCGVYPKLLFSGDLSHAEVFYQCEVCGKRTEPKVMPWIAEEAWNNGEYTGELLQYSLF